MNPHIAETIRNHACFPEGFSAWVQENLSIWLRFETEALRLAQRFDHYSSKTIWEYLRHHSALADTLDTQYKLNNDFTPYVARLFLLLPPEHAGFFKLRAVRRATHD